MQKVREWLQGKKTYIMIGFALIVGLLEFGGIDVVPDVTQDNALTYIWGAITTGFMRAGVSSIGKVK